MTSNIIHKLSAVTYGACFSKFYTKRKCLSCVCNANVCFFIAELVPDDDSSNGTETNTSQSTPAPVTSSASSPVSSSSTSVTTPPTATTVSSTSVSGTTSTATTTTATTATATTTTTTATASTVASTLDGKSCVCLITQCGVRALHVWLRIISFSFFTERMCRIFFFVIGLRW